MSFFGKNIKKIRKVKGLNQHAFAELFGLKRATLGAYEEGRSEPKIDTVIKVANYFSILIDDLLRSELTVNQLLQFKEDLTLEIEKLEKESILNIPIVTGKNQTDYLKYCDKPKFVKDLPVICLPVESNSDLRAFTVHNLEMTSGETGIYPGDIVIAEKYSIDLVHLIKKTDLVVAIVEDELVLRYAEKKDDLLILEAAHKNISAKNILIQNIKELWLVKHVFLMNLPKFKDTFEEKLIFLEKELAKLNSSKK